MGPLIYIGVGLVAGIAGVRKLLRSGSKVKGTYTEEVLKRSKQNVLASSQQMPTAARIRQPRGIPKFQNVQVVAQDARETGTGWDAKLDNYPYFDDSGARDGPCDAGMHSDHDC